MSELGPYQNIVRLDDLPDRAALTALAQVLDLMGIEIMLIRFSHGNTSVLPFHAQSGMFILMYAKMSASSASRLAS